MPLEHSDLDPLRDSIADAVKAAARADENATQALEISRLTAGEVKDVRTSQQRTERSLDEHKRNSETRHDELLKAIGGAATTDAQQAAAIAAIKAEGTKQAEDLGKLKGDISNTAIVKIASAVALVLGAIAGAITLAATQLAPVLPSVVQARYGQPAVVIQAAPSASPALSR